MTSRPDNVHSVGPSAALIARSTAAAIENPEWQCHQHALAMLLPKPGYERALVSLLAGWSEYADAHLAAGADGNVIGSDFVFNDPWADIGTSLLKLLGGERGRLDGGTFDRLVREISEANGCESEI